MKLNHLAFKKIVLALNTLTFASTQILLFTLFPIFAEKFNLPLSTIIASFTLGTILFLWGSSFWSAKSETIGREKAMTYGMLGLFMSFSTLAFLMSYAYLLSSFLVLITLFLGRFIYGTTASGIIPVAQLSRVELNAHQTKLNSMLGHSLWLNLGRALGPVILLAGRDRLNFLMYAISGWTFALLFLNVLNHTSPLTKNKITENEKSNLPFLIPLLVTLLLTTYTGILHSGLGFSLQKSFSLNAVDASALMAKLLLFGSVLMIIVQFTGRLLLKNHIKLGFMLGVGSLFIGATALAFMSTELELWIAIALICPGLALIQPSHLALVHEKYSAQELAKRIGILNSGNTIGYALGGAIASIFLGVHLNTISLVVVFLLGIAACMSIQKARL